MNFYKHHIGDYAAATAHLTFVEDAAFSRLLRIYYRDEKPLPVEVASVIRLAGARDKAERDAVKTVLSEFFNLKDDGWHSKRADEEITKAQSQADTNRRIAEEREAKKRSTNRARTEHESFNESLRSREPSQTPDTRLQTKTITVDTHTQYQPREGVCVCDPPVGDFCKALVEAGVPATSINHGHPKLLALIEAGATVVEFSETARECVSKGNHGFAYVLGTMTRRREQAAVTTLHQGPMPTSRKNTAGQRSADAAKRWLESSTQEPIEHDAHG